jgi:hypothetical protein
MSAIPSAVYHDAPEATPERQEAWARWKDNYAATCAESWLAQGASHDEALEGMACVLADFEHIDGLPWMPLGKALGLRLDHLLNPPAEPVTGTARTEFIRALRTAQSSTAAERTAVVAYQFGVSVQQAQQMTDQADKSDDPEAKHAGRTAVYRHYDAAGVLLYVGIAADPSLRSEQHAAKSPWFRFVAHTQSEWHASRGKAMAAEREAIAAESPVFNQTHNKAHRDAAVAYLFGALSEIEASA